MRALNEERHEPGLGGEAEERSWAASEVRAQVDARQPQACIRRLWDRPFSLMLSHPPAPAPQPAALQPILGMGRLPSWVSISLCVRDGHLNGFRCLVRETQVFVCLSMYPSCGRVGNGFYPYLFFSEGEW